MRIFLLIRVFYILGIFSLPSFLVAQGGDLTIATRNRSSFGQVAPKAWSSLRSEFFQGRRVFHSRWSRPDGSRTSFKGLGPLFNADSCASCHAADGRGRPHLEKETQRGDKLLYELHPSTLLLLRRPAGDGKYSAPEPVYGFQFQPLGHGAYGGENFEGEGRAFVSYLEQSFEYPDGSTKLLRVPTYEVRDLAYGDLSSDSLLMPRTAPAVFGLGLLEAISEQDILAAADAEDADGDGISGRPASAWNYFLQVWQLGRFGWTASQPSLRQQNASAAVNDMSLMNRVFEFETITHLQAGGRELPTAGTMKEPYELSDAQLSRLTLYTHLLGVPKQGRQTQSVMRGEKLFLDVGCSDCHRQSWETSERYEGVELLAGQKIEPYTDLLLHDLGGGLADRNLDGDPAESEWRTPPLWGLGLHEEVNGNSFYLHDGRARDLEEAILWHGGEAETSKNSFVQLRESDRKDIISFLKSL